MSKIAHLKLCELRETLEQTILSQARKVNDYPEYVILNDGRVIGPRGRIIRTDENSTGYLRITLSKNGIVKRVFVHRLVAEHFIDNPNNLSYVNHIDGNRKNNNSSNLEWITASGNVKDGWLRGRSSEHLKYNLPFFREGATTIP